MENLEKDLQKNENSVTPESLEIGKNYIIRAPYSRGPYEGQAFDGEVEFLGTEPDADGKPMYRFLYIKKPEHLDEVGGGSTYICQEESLKYILEK